jgi:hypothetical protein
LRASDYLEFVRTPTYERAIAGVLSQEAEREFIESRLLENPRRGVLLAGTGGFRKLRVPLEGRGKRGGGRVVYYFVGQQSRVTDEPKEGCYRADPASRRA